MADRLLELADKLDDVINHTPTYLHNVALWQSYISASKDENCRYDKFVDGDCNTPGCVAGWFAVALRAQSSNKEVGGRFTDGVKAFRDFMEYDFPTNREIKKVWMWVDDMFYECRAWGMPFGTFSPGVLVRKLRAVAAEVKENLS